jgi:hypothetical protein
MLTCSSNHPTFNTKSVTIRKRVFVPSSNLSIEYIPSASGYACPAAAHLQGKELNLHCLPWFLQGTSSSIQYHPSTKLSINLVLPKYTAMESSAFPLTVSSSSSVS